MAKNDGGTAFPTPDQSGPDGIWSIGQHGMSLRDYIAVAAMQQAMLSPTRAGTPMSEILRTVSKAAYQFADAMLAERDKEDVNVNQE